MRRAMRTYSLLIPIILVVLTGCASNGTAVTGAAAGSTSLDMNADLERCNESFGTIAIDDGRDADWFNQFGRATNVTSIEPLLRLAVQQSNCFIITSVGNRRADALVSRITDIQRNSGDFRAGSNQHKGQRVAADYFLEPHIIVNAGSGNTLGASIGGFLGGAASALAGSFESKSSVVTLALTDLRSSVQISSAQGSATATSFGATINALSGGKSTSLGGMTKTPEGKATVAAFLEADNSMIRALRNYQQQEVEGGLGTGGKLKVS